LDKPGRIATHAAVWLTALLMVGCATIRGFPNPPRVSKDAKPAEGYQLGPAAIVLYNGEDDPARKKLIRNEIIDARMAEIDAKFAEYERALYQDGVGSGVGTDWAVLSLTAATTIVGAATTKTTLAAISTAVVGGQAAFDKRALFDKTLPALMAQMVAEREKIRADIREREDSAVDSYTWFAADSDLRTFEFAGSIPGAISVISLDAGQKAAVARSLTSGQYKKDEATILLKKFWKPDLTNIDKDNEAKILAWMKKSGLDAGPGAITVFLETAEMGPMRLRAVKDLGLAGTKQSEK
jgi:hypothetical protein